MGKRASRVDFDKNPSAVAHLVLPQSSGRVGIVFYPAQGEIITISNEPNVTLQKGLTLPQSGMLLYLCLEDHGDAVQKEWYAIGSPGTNPLSFIEIFG